MMMFAGWVSHLLAAATPGLTAGERVLLAVGGVLTVGMIALFLFILRMANKDGRGGQGDTRVKK